MTEDEVKAKIADLEAEKAALKNKNSELIDREKAEKQRADKAEADAEEAAETARTENGSELDKAVRRIAKLERDLQTEADRATKADSGLRNYKASNALSQAIAKANVDASHVNLLTKALRNDIEFDDAGEPTIEGKSIQDYTKGFFAIEGKSYVRAPDHDGGGATGSDGSKPNKWAKAPETPEQENEWMNFSAKNPDDARSLANSWNRTDLAP